MQEIVSKNNIGRRYASFSYLEGSALSFEITRGCGRQAGYVMVVGRVEKLIHTA